MDIVSWLEQVKKLDRLIDAKNAERERVRALLVNTVGSLDGMPRAAGATDKIGNLTVKLISLEEELNELIDKYVDEKKKVIKTLERLPDREYGVLHRYYIRGMTLEQIADDIKYCSTQVWRIKKKGLRLLKDVIECNAKPC